MRWADTHQAVLEQISLRCLQMYAAAVTCRAYKEEKSEMGRHSSGSCQTVINALLVNACCCCCCWLAGRTRRRRMRWADTHQAVVKRLSMRCL
jgi:hypothetical protein